MDYVRVCVYSVCARASAVVCVCVCVYVNVHAAFITNGKVRAERSRVEQRAQQR